MPFVVALAFAALVDLRTRRLPNALTVPGAVVATLLLPLTGTRPWTDAAGGLLLAVLLSGFVFILARGAFGMGDVKLSAFIGAAVGLGGVVPFLALASGLGSAGALVALIRGARHDDAIAFGPCLAAAGIIVWCLGP